MASEPKSPGGSTIHRYKQRPFVGADASHAGGYLKEISDHLTGFLGPSDFVFHEVVSDAVHVDILQFPPTARRDYWTFVTCGMSDRPMKVPPELAALEDLTRAELVLSLPAGWVASNGKGGFDRASLDRDERWWPFHWLTYLARFPHKYGAWLWATHSIPNGDPPSPLGIGTRMTGWVLDAPRLWPADAIKMRKPELSFHAAIPVYREEMAFKLRHGSDALFDLFDRNHVTELLSPARRPVV